jgi:NAD(P)-dependent dehydrogenase (short-subunit alcohol dehydrogenase family)
VISPDDVRLDGRVAVVTGAAAGIGQASAAALEAFGATVIGIDRDPGTTHTADVRDHAAIAEIAAGIEQVDILVNNAGGTFHAPFESLSVNADETLIRENLLQVVWTTRAFLPALRKSSAPSVINVTSIEAHRAAPNYAVYAAAKAGVANLAMSLALELAPIRINNIAVDMTPTPAMGEFGDGLTAIGRIGHVDDTAGAVVFLAGNLSGFVTGSTIHVDGGNLAAAGWHRTENGWRP